MLATDRARESASSRRACSEIPKAFRRLRNCRTQSSDFVNLTIRVSIFRRRRRKRAGRACYVADGLDPTHSLYNDSTSVVVVVLFANMKERPYTEKG